MRLFSAPRLSLAVALVAGCTAIEPAELDEPVPSAASTPTQDQRALEAAAARASAVAERQASGGTDYHLAPLSGGPSAPWAVGHCEPQGMSLRFDDAGSHVTLVDGSWFTLRLAGVGRETSRVAAPATRWHVDEATFVYDRPEILEWYRNGPLGVEQGFEVMTRPPGEGPLVITVATDGPLEPELGGETIDLVDAHGYTRANYGELYAQDATGEPLPSWMATDADGAIALHVDDGGATYPITIDPLAWVEQDKLEPFDGVADDRFSDDLDVSGDTIIVGSRLHDGVGYQHGAVYIFVRQSGLWTLEQKLPHPSPSINAQFGWAVSVSGDTAAIGAPRGGAGGTWGTVFIYERSAGSWTLQQELVNPTSASNFFVREVDLDGDDLIVGSPDDDGGRGAAFVFVRSAGVWSHQQQLVASDGIAGDELGESVAISGDHAIAGAWRNGSNGFNAGAAYVYERSGSTWTETQKLTPNNPAAFDNYGFSVAISGTTALVGAQGTRTADVLTFDGMSWNLQQTLTPPATATGNFGRAVALDGDTAIAGNSLDDELGSNAGAAYVFTRAAGTWTRETKLTAADGGISDRLGWSVAVDGDTTALGARGDAAWRGSAYAFVLGDVGASCNTNADCTLGFCVDGVCCDRTCGNGNPNDCRACLGSQTGLDDGICAPILAGTQCRATQGACDVAESCDGTSTDCPADAKEPNTVECRASAGGCDPAEQCTGFTNDCPPDAKEAAGTECRAAAGDCDVAESCNGTSAACPADAKAPTGTTCRTAAGACDVAESCDGTSDACPADALEPSMTICRPAVDLCDVAESCDGSNVACPADQVAPATTTCRPSTGSCDPAELCDGASTSCPTDALASAGSSGDPNCTPYLCTGTSADCGTSCTIDDDCSADHFCDDGACVAQGSLGAACIAENQCLSGFCADGVCCDTACGDSDGSDCQACAANLTGGSDGSCVAVSQGVECRASAGACDPAEQCNGTSTACPADELASDGTECRAAGGACDLPEVCDGASVDCPIDARVAAGTSCREAANACDIAEQCDGSSVACPPDEVEADGIACDDGDDCTDGDACQAGVCSPGSDVCGAGGGEQPPAEVPVPPSADEEAGCSCRAAGRSAPRDSSWLAGLVLLGLAGRRRRRQGRPFGDEADPTRLSL